MAGLWPGLVAESAQNQGKFPLVPRLRLRLGEAVFGSGISLV
jgi:hypothetical protein